MAKNSIQKSTIVRTFRTLERLAPAAGARWAERLWFTIPSPGAPRPPEGGEPFEVRTAGRVVRGWTWGRGPVVYLAHGWGGYAGQLAGFVPALTAAGFTVIAHDALSHGASDPGRSGPRASDIVELAQSLDRVAAEYGPAQAVVGHSMGGLAALLAIRDGWLGTRRLVMVAPMLNAVEFMPVFAGRVGFGPRTQRRLVPRIERRVGAALESFDAETILTGASRPPLLAVHDRDDAETPYDATEALVAGWPEADLMTTRGLGHRRILRDADVVRTVTDTLVADLTRGLPRPA
jgi:alpha-beta hydrolase superfamily lysophospholipase